ncbi:MAG: outer membrane protein assembly factor BamA [Thiotrichales bacterium 35-46-9]|nr:MAG: outer membrane protein assembly factor BamA [Thiotrichales bacterium 35-46-9]
MLKKVQVGVSLLAMGLMTLAQAAPKVEFEGLERVTPETALSYISVPTTDKVSKAQVKDMIKSLFATGFFSDVKVYQSNGQLKIKVVERPSIAEIKLEGSKLIKEEELLQALEVIGIKKGRILNESDLDRIAQDVRQRYQNQGYYATVVEPKAEALDRNRVGITIKVQEGELARITKINIVGNKAFDESKLVGLLSLSEPTMWSWLTDADQYARTKLQADLETLRSYYMDKGYADFRILSSQVSISSDKTRVYVNINMNEGRQYTISEVKFAGTSVLTEAKMTELLKFKTGDSFARNKITDSTNAIKDKLSEQGYAFAEVEPKPVLDKEKGLVSLVIDVNPRNRAYVRRIEVKGNNRTRDHVVRRELRQFEAAPYNLSAVRQSQTRLKRLGFFKTVDIETQRVGADQVDLVVKVEEMPTGAITASIGYSQVENMLLGFSLSERNIFGTGNNATFSISSSSARKNYDINITNPYFTPEGDSLSAGFFWREIDAAYLFLAPYSTNTIGGRVMYGIPLSEEDRLNFGVQAERLSIVFQGEDNAGPPPGFGYALKNNLVASDPAIQAQYNNIFKGANSYNDISLKSSYVHDSRDEFYFPNKGHYHSSSVSVSTPVGDLTYYQLDVQQKFYLPVTERSSLSLTGTLGYGKGYGNLDGYGLPFFRRYYAGGIQTVRGYEAFSLGNRYDFATDGSSRALGGDFLAVASAALNFRPWFIEDSSNMRLSWFFDAGNVYPDPDKFKVDELRLSTGLGFSWITPIGPLTFSYAKPLNPQTIDRTQEVQFTIGVPF